jgi:peroxiredoxin
MIQSIPNHWLFFVIVCMVQLPALAQSPSDSMLSILKTIDRDSMEQGAFPEEQMKLIREMKLDAANKYLGKPFPDFQLPLLRGDTIRKQDLLGRKVLLNFWFADCQPCIDEMPLLNELKAEFAEEEVIFLAVTFEPEERVHRFLQHNTFDFKHAFDGRGLAKEAGVRFYPSTMILDENGVVQLAESGAAHVADPEAAAAWKRRIVGLLRGE